MMAWEPVRHPGSLPYGKHLCWALADLSNDGSVEHRGKLVYLVTAVQPPVFHSENYLFVLKSTIF